MKRIEIQNFQSHEHTVLDLHPGVNGLVGLNDVGKSAIMRAIRKVIENRPEGNKFRSRWGGPTSIKIDMPNCVVERVIDKENLYILDDDPKKPGRTVPEVVKEALNIDPLSIQRQTDKHFLLGESPPEAARILNRAAGLDQIDRAISYLKSLQKKTNQDKKYSKAQIIKKRVELKELEWIDSVEPQMELAEKISADLVSLTNKIERLNSLIDDRVEIEAELDKLSFIKKAGKKLKAAKKCLADYEATKKKYTLLFFLIDKRMDIQGEITLWEKKTVKAKANYKRLMPNQCPLCGRGCKCGK